MDAGASESVCVFGRGGGRVDDGCRKAKGASGGGAGGIVGARQIAAGHGRRLGARAWRYPIGAWHPRHLASAARRRHRANWGRGEGTGAGAAGHASRRSRTEGIELCGETPLTTRRCGVVWKRRDGRTRTRSALGPATRGANARLALTRGANAWGVLGVS